MRSSAVAPVVGLAVFVSALSSVQPAAKGFESAAKVPDLDLTPTQGWQMLSYQGCRYAVPASWHAAAEGGLATAPDGSNISIRIFRISNWSSHKAQIKAAFGRVNMTHEDSDRRLWFEIGDKPRVQHYIDVLNGLSVCSALLEVRTTTRDTDDTAKRIVESVGPAADKWPPDSLK